MILEHFSNAPVGSASARDFPQSYHKEGWGFPMKPDGLWVSVKGDDDWEWWCKAEGFRPEFLTHRHVVHLAKDANILVIQGKDELLAFDAEWGVDWRIGDSPFFSRRIDWPKLAEKYDGIVIAPYIWECRLMSPRSVSDWYYPWDCASGCIWKARAVDHIELVEITPFEEEQAA